MRIANKLASVLTQRQWSHAQLSECTDIPYAVVRRLVQPGTDPSLHYALRISEALAMPIESLFVLQAEPARANRGAV